MTEAEMVDYFNTMVQQFVGARTIETVVASYDAYATAAMQAIVREDVNGDPRLIAQEAWQIADAMMAERKKRGIGGFDTSDRGAKREVDAPAEGLTLDDKQ